MRSLARALVHVDDVDDVVQRVFVAVVRKGGGRESSSWIPPRSVHGLIKPCVMRQERYTAESGGGAGLSTASRRQPGRSPTKVSTDTPRPTPIHISITPGSTSSLMTGCCSGCTTSMGGRMRRSPLTSELESTPLAGE